ncbi:MAG: rhodanese-like domain-containing protein [Pseudomonadota bacterium]
MSRSTFLALATCAASLGVGSALADDVRITTFKDAVTFSMGGQTFVVNRDQNTRATVPQDFALTSRACPPNCIQPMIAADGVETLGELELLGFLTGPVSDSTGLLLDVRAPADFASGAVPGAVNVPASTLSDENRYRTDILRALGATGDDDALDFSGAMALTLYAGGPWSPDARNAIIDLLEAGYPSEKLFFFRSGMQGWVSLGLTTVSSQNPG